MSDLHMISRPTLIIDEEICRANIARMSEKASRNKIELRPHFKTHQSHTIGAWFRDYGVSGITVSSLGMARYFANDGWTDITVAFPCNINEIHLINELAKEVSLRLLISNDQIAQLLAIKLEAQVDVYIEIDEGGGRTGFAIDDVESIEQTIEELNNSNFMSFYGIYCHVGQTYSKRNKEDVVHFANGVLSNLSELKNTLSVKYGSLKLCYGDTPSCSLLDDFEEVDEISTGNFAFYDVMQNEIGSCHVTDIAVALACPVVSVNARKAEVCIYGGAIHLSKDKTDSNTFGLVAELSGNQEVNNLWNVIPGACFKKVSQEHGIIQMPSDIMSNISVGDVLYILPIHSCLTADCMGGYYLKDGTFIDHYSQKKHV